MLFFNSKRRNSASYAFFWHAMIHFCVRINECYDIFSTEETKLQSLHKIYNKLKVN